MKTVILDTAKLLKEAGFLQESYFWWVQDNGHWHLEHERPQGQEWENFECIAALTSDEILDQLPYEVRGYLLNFGKCSDSSYMVYYNKSTFANPSTLTIEDQGGETFAEARRVTQEL